MFWHQTRRRLRAMAMIGVTATVAFAAVVTAAPAHAAGPYTVNSTVDLHDADPADGACDTGNVLASGQAECTLRAAVEQANADGVFTQLVVPSGTHQLTLDEIEITTDLYLLGGRNVVIDGNDQDRIFNINDPVVVTIENVTMQHGRGGNGGAVRNRHGDLTLVKVVLQENRALGPGSLNKGGAVYNAATLAIINSHLEANEALGSGGAIWSNGTLGLSGTSVLSNVGQAGGGVANNGGGAWIVDSIISANRATGIAGSGGGIANTAGAKMRIESSYVSLNVSEQYEGGGIRNMGVLSVQDTTISHNDAALSGGGVYNTGAFEVAYSTFSRNDAGGVGGAVALSNAAGTVSRLTATNTTFSTNRARRGGAIATQRGGTVVTLLHVTIADNQAGVWGEWGEDSAAIWAATDSIVDYRNTILAEAAGAAVCGGNATALISSGHNLATDSTCNLTALGDQPATNPMLDPLASNGGFTQTHALQTASPAVDAAMTVSPQVFRDQRHLVRLGSRPDVGAYEITRKIIFQDDPHFEVDTQSHPEDEDQQDKPADRDDPKVEADLHQDMPPIQDAQTEDGVQYHPPVPTPAGDQGAYSTFSRNDAGGVGGAGTLSNKDQQDKPVDRQDLLGGSRRGTGEDN